MESKPWSVARGLREAFERYGGGGLFVALESFNWEAWRDNLGRGFRNDNTDVHSLFSHNSFRLLA
jgi:hypothetical protein